MAWHGTTANAVAVAVALLLIPKEEVHMREGDTQYARMHVHHQSQTHTHTHTYIYRHTYITLHVRQHCYCCYCCFLFAANKRGAGRKAHENRTRTGRTPTHTACLFLVVYASPSYRHHYQPSWSCSPSPPILSFVDFFCFITVLHSLMLFSHTY